jgi:hypothetical protein
MTKLTTESKAELQRMIDIGAKHMRAQGCCSISADGLICLYRGHNLKCFGGALISDEHYTKALENKSISDPPVIKALTASGYNVSDTYLCSALEDAQEELHDGLKGYGDFPVTFEAALITYCSEYGLDYTAPGETL